MVPASARPIALSRGVVVALGVSLGIVSLLGVTQHARRLAVAERAVVRTDIPGGSPHETWGAFGVFTVRPGDVLRITACPLAAGDPHLRLELRTAAGDRVLSRPLTAAASDARRCVGLRWPAPGAVARSVTVALAAASPSPPPLSRVALYVGPPLHPGVTWTWLALAVSLGMLVLAPSVSHAPLLRTPTLASLIFRPVADRPGAPVALLGAFVATVILSGQVFRALGPSPLATLLGALALHAGFGLTAAWFLGGFDRHGPGLRASLGLGAAPPRGFAAAPPVALGLLLLALATSTFITDTSESSVARDVASSPMRLVLLYTALVAPLSEELFYRGAVTRALERFGAARAVVLQAVIFTLPHALQLRGALWGLVPIAALAVVNGCLRRASGGLVVPWLVHSLYNGALIASTLLAGV